MKKKTFFSYYDKYLICPNYVVKLVVLGAFLIILLASVLSLVSIFFSKKKEIEESLQKEITFLESVVYEHFNYSKYFVNILGNNIKENPDDLEFVNRTMQYYSEGEDFNNLFGWSKYSWVNDGFFIVVESLNGISAEPRFADYVAKIVENTNACSKEIFTSVYNQKIRIMEHVCNVFDQYIGSLLLTYDSDLIANSINLRKNNDEINFALVDYDYNLVVASKGDIKNIFRSKGVFIDEVYKAFVDLKDEEIVHVDLFGERNFIVKFVPNAPLILLVNLDVDYIKDSVKGDLVKDLIKIMLISLCSIIIVILLYQNEKLHRDKIAKAVKIANNATSTKSNFLAFTAHEIRSPLGFIMTGSEMIAKECFGDLSEKYIEYAKGIHESSNVILNFIDDILDEKQILEGNLKSRSNLFDIDTVIYESIKENKKRFCNEEVIYNLDIEPNLPRIVGDKDRLVQVFNNLISNSIKYSGRKIEINITCRSINKDLECTVSDKGIGIKEEEIPVALSPYGTAHGNELFKGASYGLGLSVVKMILKAHEAKFFFSSEYKYGTTIKIVFPHYKLVYNGKKGFL